MAIRHINAEVAPIPTNSDHSKTIYIAYSKVGEKDGRADSPLEQLDHYFQLREEAKASPLPGDHTINYIQESVGDQLNLHEELSPKNLKDRYGQYDPDSLARVSRLNKHLRDKYGSIIPQVVLDASDAFIATVRSMYETPASGNDADGSFGFVVPARASRTRPQDSVETIDPCPSLRYVPDELRIAMYAGFPPFVLDRYQEDAQGKRGYMILSPVFPDMHEDIGSTARAMSAARNMVNDAVQFGRDKLGIRIFGLGASLPAVTHFGESITVPDVVTTTGHGGTIALILKTVQALEARGAVSDAVTHRLGMLGLGSIGGSIAKVMAATYPDAQISLYDPVAKRRDELSHALLSAGRKEESVINASSVQQVLEASDIIVSAVTGKIDLQELNVGQLNNRVIVEDSQPWAFDRRQVEQSGAREVWVVGEDQNGDVAKRASSWNIGGTLLPGSLFGCEAEAATLARLHAEFEQNQGLQEALHHVVDTETGEHIPTTSLDLVEEAALRRAVVPEDALRFGGLFERYGITVASQFQAEGKPTYFPVPTDMPRNHTTSLHESETEPADAHILSPLKLVHRTWFRQVVAPATLWGFVRRIYSSTFDV